MMSEWILYKFPFRAKFCNPSTLQLPVTFFSLGNNQTHGRGSHRSYLSPRNPSLGCFSSYFRPGSDSVLLWRFVFFPPKNGRIILGIDSSHG